MLLRTETKYIQEQMARFCKTGQTIPLEGAQLHRLAHYRRLVFSNVSSTLTKAFPITAEWLPEEEWYLLVNDFFDKHDAQTPMIWKLPKEFAHFVIENEYAVQLKKPALPDLLWFEWLEIDVHTMDDVPLPDFDFQTFSSDALLRLNPYCQIQHLAYPIHLMNADKAAGHKGTYHVLIYRDLLSGQVNFIQLSPMSAFFLKLIKAQSQSLSQVLPDLASFAKLRLTKKIEHSLILFCTDLLNKKILIIS